MHHLWDSNLFFYSSLGGTPPPAPLPPPSPSSFSPFFLITSPLVSALLPPPFHSSVFTLTPCSHPPSLFLFHYFIRVQTNGLSRLWSTRGGKSYTVSTTPDGKSNDTDCHRPLQGQMLDGATVIAATALVRQWGAAKKEGRSGK